MLKKIFLTIVLFCISNLIFSQEINYKEYSYTELFKLIEEEKDSVFKLEDALIKYNLKTDSLFFILKTDEGDKVIRKNRLIINKQLHFNNVHFQNHIFYNKDKNAGYLANIHFKKEVHIRNAASLNFKECIFDEKLEIGGSGEFCQRIIDIAVKKDVKDKIDISNSTLKKGLKIFYNCNYVKAKPETNIFINGNEIYSNKDEKNPTNLEVTTHRIGFIGVSDNTFYDKASTEVYNSFKGFAIQKNNFKESTLIAQFDPEENSGKVYFYDNIINTNSFLLLPYINKSYDIEYTQFKKGIINFNSWFFNFEEYISKKNDFSLNVANDSLQNAFLNNDRFKKLNTYNSELSSKGAFYDYYKSKHNTDIANQIYIDIKDLETERLAYLNEQNPNFDNFFTLKINQFLKVFSDYGTRPSKAIIFSMYVILIFAFIYLLFPNSWDSHGKKRLMHRFEFFQKYLRRKEGMHSIYLEDKQEEISSYEDFKTNLENSKTELPSFFISWSKPLYNASMFSSKLTAKFLQNTDVLKGKWQDLSPKQKRFKNIQIGFLLLLGLLYDLFIKALNALMLSINTFTTLGFGEIPIKGLPRYLAIIQGFIGWFMLTIFSVSLISQLLN